MRSLAGFALGTAALFLAVMAVLINTPVLFFMGTALAITIAFSRLQAWLAVRGMRFERHAPSSVKIGEVVPVEITVWSETKIRRPLITVVDTLPLHLRIGARTPSLPIAPAYDQAIRTVYRFRPLRRGVYRWKSLTAFGTDALGLITMQKSYQTTAAEVTVLPVPIPLQVDLPLALGWGVREAESGSMRGSGMEPCGVREYVVGDALKHIHWPSSARTGNLLVREYEAAMYSTACLVIQRSHGSDLPGKKTSSLDLMCGHALYLTEHYFRQGTNIEFPQFDEVINQSASAAKIDQLATLLAGLKDDHPETLAVELETLAATMPFGTVVFTFISVVEPGLLNALEDLRAKGIHVVPLLYDSGIFEAKQKKVMNPVSPDFVEGLKAIGIVPMVVPMGAYL